VLLQGVSAARVAAFMDALFGRREMGALSKMPGAALG